MVDLPEPTVRVTRYEVSCLPEDLNDAYAGNFTITVEYREPVTDEERADYERGREEWLSAHRFDEQTALALAREAAPDVTVNGYSVAHFLQRAAARKATDG